MGIGFLVGLALAFLVGGLQGRMLALCGLSRTGREKRSRFVRADGPFTLAMTAFGTAGHSCGKLPHLLLAQVFTEAVYTGWRGPVRGKRRRDFIGRLGINNDGVVVRRRLRDQMERLLGCAISLYYLSDNKSVGLASVIVDETVFRRDFHRPDMDNLFPSDIRLSQPYFDSIVCQPVPIDLNCLHALRRSTLGLDLYRWLTYRTVSLTNPLPLTWNQVYAQHGPFPENAGGSFTVQHFRKKCLRKPNKIQLTWPELHYTTEPGRLILHPTPAQTPPGAKDGRLRFSLASFVSTILLRFSQGDRWPSSLPKSLSGTILRSGLWLPPAARRALDPLGRRKPAARTLDARSTGRLSLPCPCRPAASLHLAPLHPPRYRVWPLPPVPGERQTLTNP